MCRSETLLHSARYAVLLLTVMLPMGVCSSAFGADKEPKVQLTIDTGVRSVVVESVLGLKMQHGINGRVNFDVRFPSMGDVRLQYGAIAEDLLGFLEDQGALIETQGAGEQGDALRYLRLSARLFGVLEALGMDVGQLRNIFAAYRSESYGIRATAGNSIVFVPSYNCASLTTARSPTGFFSCRSCCRPPPGSLAAGL